MKKENERSSWKPERVAWLQKTPRSKTWKGDLERRKSIKGVQGMESSDNQALLVYGKAEFDICSEKTKDIGRGAHSG